MRLPRFSIASLLAVTAILAVALAALRSPSYLWANVTFSVGLAALVVAILNAVYGRAAGRAYWLGFALCGGIYFAVCSMPGLRDSVCPRLATEVVFDFLYPQMSPPTTTAGGAIVTTNSNWVVSGLSSGTFSTTETYTTTGNGRRISVVQPPPESNSPWAAWTEPDRTVGVGYKIGTVALRSSEAFRQIGHSMFTLLVAVVGGTFARHRYRISVMNRAGLEPTP